MTSPDLTDAAQRLDGMSRYHRDGFASMLAGIASWMRYIENTDDAGDIARAHDSARQVLGIGFRGLCSCHEHRDGASDRFGDHRYTLEEEPWPEVGSHRWRWMCSCSSAGGKWQGQSPSVSYHGWMRHIGGVR